MDPSATSINAAVQGRENWGIRDLRRGRYALLAMMAIWGTGCGESESTSPLPPGSISLTTETAGFMKDDSYELFVNGETQGTIGANDVLTISGLDPATYQLDLGDVADNCAVAATSVEVVSEQTANVSLSVVCGHPDPVSYAIRFGRERPNLDNGEITVCPFSLCPTEQEWDLYVFFNSQTTPHSVIRQNQTTGVEIAHLPGVVFEELTEEDFNGATFATDLVADPFDSGRVILIRTDMGDVYALGNPVEDTVAQTLTFDAALIATAP